jgi:tripartite-type tricarboxylate transporter receptor subunit TctC
MIRFSNIVAASAVGLAALALNFEAPAASVADFYRGKTISVVVGTTPGGTNDFIARTLVTHMKKHIPGSPKIIVRNMPGAGSMRATNYLFNVANKDGTAFGTMIRGLVLGPLLDIEGVAFDASRFNWIGSVNKVVMVGAVWKTAPARTLEQMKKTPIIVGATGPSTGMSQFPAIYNATLGTKFKIVYGYPGGSQVTLAMERGEVQARLGWTYGALAAEKPHWLKDGTIKLFIQMGVTKHPALPNVPFATDLAKTREDRQMIELLSSQTAFGRPYFAPPDVPTDRIKALKAAFNATMSDKGFLRDAGKRHIVVDPVSATELSAIVDKIYKTPKPVVERVKKILAEQKMVKRKAALAKVTAKVTKLKRGGRMITLGNGKTYRISGRFTKKLTVAGVTGRVRGKIKVGMTCSFEADGSSVIRGTCN